MDGRNGLFVGLPAYRRKDENGKDTYSDIVRLTEDDFKKAFQKAALDAFATGEEFTIKTVEGKDDPDINVGVSLLNNEGKTKALARLHIENVVDVNSVAIREGRDGGLFVSMPSYQTSKTDDVGNPVYQNYCYAATKEFAETLSKAVLNKYETVQNELLSTPEKSSEKPSLDSQLTEAKKNRT